MVDIFGTAKCMQQPYLVVGLESVLIFILYLQRPWKTDFIDAIYKLTKKNPDDGINVLVHGDCHTNNAMFTHDDENNITSCLLVDYQMSYWTSPVIDLMYFLVGSPEIGIKVKYFDYLIYHYYKNFAATLRKLGYKKKIPTATDIHIDILKRGVMAVMNSLQVLPVMLLDPSEDSKMENFMKQDEEAMRFKNTLYNNPRYRAHMNELFPFFENKGFLELELTPPAPKKPELPEWVNKEFFKDILEENYGATEILDVVVSSTGGAGENYASLMFKAEVKYKINDEEKFEYFIVKSMHTNEAESQMLAAFQIFPKEMEMYEKTIPILEKIFKDAGEKIQFGAKCFKTGSEPLEYIVMEDLTKRNFRCEVRQLGLDMNHCKAILEKLAKFHAASAVSYEINGPFSEKFNEGMLNEKMIPLFKQMGEANHQIMVDSIRTWPEVGEKFANLLLPWKTRIFEEAIKSVKKNPEPGFNVLCHGDLWTNNFMYTHDEENNIEEVLMVDYQTCFWSSPAVDLLYFIIGSPKIEIKVNEFDTLVHHYYTVLVQMLKKLKYQKKIPTLIDLHVDILKRGIFGFMNSFGVMTAILLDPGTDAKMENMMNSDDAALKFKQRMYTNPRFIEHIQKLLPFFEKKGILNIDDEES